MEISQINMMISQAKRSSNIQFQDAEFRLQQMARTSNRTQNEENTRIRMESSVTGNGTLLNITI
ncbi:MAG: hypothetical protein K5900_00290 [Butyrivibrio sp.]|nr:hypothetical protein [Butyrivibrio sp.]